MRKNLLILVVNLFLFANVDAAYISGPPTYTSNSTINEDRGVIYPLQFFAKNSTGYAGNNATSASAIQTFIPVGSTEPTEARGIASPAQLKSLSRVTGQVGSPNPNFPFVEARNISTNTRYFSFSTQTGAATVPLDILAVMDGTLTSSFLAELTSEVRSTVRFGLEIVDTAGTLITPVFDVQADNRWIGAGSFAVTGTSSGAIDPADWQAAIGPSQPLAGLGGITVDIDLFKLIKNAYDAPVGQILGLRWFLETQARLEAAYGFPSGEIILSDFFNTANLGFELNEAAPLDTLVTEFLSVAPVPIPPAVALFFPALLALLRCRRKSW